MALLNKAGIAAILNISASLINDEVYNWALKQFYALIGRGAAETTKTFRKFVGTDSQFIKLPYKNLSEISTLTIDGVATTFTLNSDLFFNADTGLVKYTTGFATGQYIIITCKVAAYVHSDEYNYLIALLVLRGIAMFTPQYTNQVESIKIGRYSKSFGGVQANLDDYIMTIEMEIKKALAIIRGDDDQMSMGDIV